MAEDVFELHPFLNACLNMTSAFLLVLGYRAIKSGVRETHRRFMLGAFAVSTLFLISYLARFALTGSHPFPGEGVLRVVYLSILISHMILAAAVPVLAIGAIRFALRDEIERHKRWAKLAFPIWVYVSVTGVVVYLMLYQLPVTT